MKTNLAIKSKRDAAITPEVIEPLTYDGLLTGIGELLERARSDIARHVNVTLVRTYWATGRYIVEYEQNGSDRAKYGDCLIKRLARDLTVRHGKGYSRTNLVYMRKLYLTFRKSQTLSDLLSWSRGRTSTTCPSRTPDGMASSSERMRRRKSSCM